MKRYAHLLSSVAPVVAFDYAYMKKGSRRPDSQAKLLDTHREALDAGRTKYGEQVVLIGKSMGSRIGCHLALAERALGVVCLGYPLIGMGKTAKLRDEVLLELPLPTLFVQGTRDKLCPLKQLREVIDKRKARSELHVVESGDHSLLPTKTFLKQNDLSLEDIEQQVVKRIRAFVEELLN